jgi:hypothetical protein
MAKKMKKPNKAKRTKQKKAKPSAIEKAMKSLPPASEDFMRVVNNEPGYGLI